jgi:hypothetical protein
MACAEAGIVNGYADNSYHPAGAVTRAQMAAYLSRALTGEAGVPPPPEAATFPDVPTTHWACSFVEYAVSANVVTGYADGLYHPEWQVTRAQMAVFIARAIVEPTGEEGLADYVPPTTPSFWDVPTTHWAYRHVEYIASQGVTGGYPDGAYRPTVTCTRDQMAVYIARAFGLVS